MMTKFDAFEIFVISNSKSNIKKVVSKVKVNVTFQVIIQVTAKVLNHAQCHLVR